MLLSLHIENVAVLRCVELSLANGFSAFTGETGAGKSMIIDSINFLLGSRADRDMIRKGETTASVSAIFSDISPEIQETLSSFGIAPDEEGLLMVTRTLSIDGHSSVRINARPATLSVLRAVTPLLLHIHGQNDNRTLTDTENHIHILDGYADNGEARATYAEAYAALTAVRREIRAITLDESERLRQSEMLTYQLADIDAVAPRTGEEEKLEEKRARLRHAERIEKQSSFAYRALKGSEKGSVTYILSRTISALTALHDIIPESAELSAKLEDYMWQIDDIAERVLDFSDGVDGDPTAELDRVEERLDGIHRLLRKYGADIDEVLAFREKAAVRLDELTSADDRLARLKREEKTKISAAKSAAEELHKTRVAAAERLVAELTGHLSFLDMPRVRFEIPVIARLEGEARFDKNGYDDVEFLIATNIGEPAAPMAKIASGGELSRIMLALKSAIADKDGIPTVIYDEIDTGVSGKTARKIGLKLKEAASSAQVLCVTHSAQIASLADTHYQIRKEEKNGRAETEVYALDYEGRVAELSRILGGLSVTEAQRRAALDMLEGN